MTLSIDKLSTSRRRILLIFGLAYLVWQVPQLNAIEGLLSEHVGWQNALYALGLISFLASVVWLVRIQSQMKAANADTQAVLDDELVKANRVKATNFGYTALFLTAITMMIATDFFAITAVDVARLCVIVGVVVPVISFALLER